MTIFLIYLLSSITSFVLTICCIVASWVRANKILVEIGEQEYKPGIVCEAIVTLFVIFESAIPVYNIYIIWSVTHKWVDDYVPIILHDVLITKHPDLKIKMVLKHIGGNCLCKLIESGVCQIKIRLI